MNPGDKAILTSVKRSLFRHPAAVAAAGALLGALAVMNGVAIFRGMDSPWLLGAAIVADVVAVGLGALLAAREVMVADRRIEATDARLGAIVDSAMDAIITVDVAQHVVQFNRAAEQLFDCTRADALGAPLERFLPQRYRAAHRGHVEKFGTTGTTSRRMGDMTTLWALRADGSEFPIEASISQATDGERRFYTVILRDITRRKEYEEELQRSQRELRELSARVLDAREEEKAHIARELHDELGQMLTALKMDLAELRRRLPAGDHDLAGMAGGMDALLDRTVSATRRISADLRPMMLDDLGLADAADWLIQEFAKRSGVACDVHLPAAEVLQDTPKAVATALYRALQESLTNIARHSGARKAWIVIAVQDGEIRMEVEDDGRGIAAADLAKVRSLGLKGMRERFTFIGGALEIDAAPRGGTRLRIRAPIRGMQAGSAP
jgi:PAS domain S-box-containing protein